MQSPQFLVIDVLAPRFYRSEFLAEYLSAGALSVCNVLHNDRRGSSPKILGNLAPGPLHVIYPTMFLSLWTALIVSSQFKVLVVLSEHITPVFQSHSEGAHDDNYFHQIFF